MLELSALINHDDINQDTDVRIILIVLCLLTLSCSTPPSGKNPSAYDYQIDEAAIKKTAIKKVILATQPMGTPVLSHLRRGEKRVRAAVKNYLVSNGYELVPEHYFKNAWKQAERTFGNPYDPTTGRLDSQTWRRIMITAGKNLREQTDADAIIFADLIEHEAQHSSGMKHYARWFGVSRKPNLVGAGDGVSSTFNWSQSVKVASIQVTMFTIDLKHIFASYGGIDVTQGIDLKRSNPAYIRRKQILKNDNFIEQGVEIAFHPFIPMDDYPGKSLEQRKREAKQQAPKL